MFNRIMRVVAGALVISCAVLFVADVIIGAYLWAGIMLVCAVVNAHSFYRAHRSINRD